MQAQQEKDATTYKENEAPKVSRQVIIMEHGMKSEIIPHGYTRHCLQQQEVDMPVACLHPA